MSLKPKTLFNRCAFSPHCLTMIPVICFSTHLLTAQHKNMEDKVQWHLTSPLLPKTTLQSSAQLRHVSLWRSNEFPGWGVRSWYSSFSSSLYCPSNLSHSQGLESLGKVSGQLDSCSKRVTKFKVEPLLSGHHCRMVSGLCYKGSATSTRYQRKLIGMWKKERLTCKRELEFHTSLVCKKKKKLK